MDSTAIADRLKAEVPALRRVGVAADLATVLQGKLADQTGISAFVIGMGERGAVPDLVTGAFSQQLVETVAVILTTRSIDNRAGDKAVDEIEAVKAATRRAIAGWAPPGDFDVFAVARGGVVSFVPGFFAYSIEFTKPELLRIME